MFRPMIPLAFSVAILDELTRLARLEIDNAPLFLATLGTAAADCRNHLLLLGEKKYLVGVPRPQLLGNTSGCIPKFLLTTFFLVHCLL